MPKIKGTHLAMKSAMLAAESIYDALMDENFHSETEGMQHIRLDLRQFSFVILFGSSWSAVSCESGATEASGLGCERVGPNKIADETWGKSIIRSEWVKNIVRFVR